MIQYLVGKKRLFRKLLVNPFDFLVHYNEIKNLLKLFQATHTLEPDTLLLHIKFNDQIATFYPLFDNKKKKRRYYSSDLNETVLDFAGWRPYKPQELKSFGDKLVFKDKLSQHEILTPMYSTDPQTSLVDIIVKRRVGSFSQHIYGPFRQSNEHHLDLNQGEFFEQFIQGTLVKIWFWCERPAAIMLRDMCYVIGNGKNTISDFIENVPNRLPGYPRKKYITQTLDYFNRNLSTILKKDERQLIDFRWAGSRAWFQKTPFTVLTELEKRQLALEVTRLGKILWRLISEETKENLVYTVDAILTENRQLSILEVNSNPAVHPYTYRFMCDDVLANLLDKKIKAKAIWGGGIFGTATKCS